MQEHRQKSVRAVDCCSKALENLSSSRMSFQDPVGSLGGSLKEELFPKVKGSIFSKGLRPLQEAFLRSFSVTSRVPGLALFRRTASLRN